MDLEKGFFGAIRCHRIYNTGIGEEDGRNRFQITDNFDHST